VLTFIDALIIVAVMYSARHSLFCCSAVYKSQ